MKPAIAILLLLMAACSAAPAPEPDAAAASTDAGRPTAVDADAAADADPAAAPAVTAGEVPAGQVLLELDCRGHDPDWRLRIAGDGQGRLREDGNDIALVGALEATAGGHAWRAAPADRPSESFAALMTPVACFAPGGGNAREFTAALSFADGRQASGCCSADYGLDVLAAADFATADAFDWTADLRQHLALVERCVHDGGVDVRAVTHLRDGDGGKLVVRMRDSDDARFDCLIDVQDRDIETLAPVAADDQVFSESGSEWLPADADDLPRLDCGRVYRVSGTDGEVRGWVHQRDGC